MTPSERDLEKRAEEYDFLAPYPMTIRERGKIAFLAGARSRDAEISRLREALRESVRHATSIYKETRSVAEGEFGYNWQEEYNGLWQMHGEFEEFLSRISAILGEEKT